MPYLNPETIAPEIALEHGGVTVFHTYRDGVLEEGRMTCWFTLNPDDLEELDHFDVRELRAWVDISPGDEDTRILAALRHAIDNGEIGGNEPC
jgi:hypothetical protein